MRIGKVAPVSRAIEGSSLGDDVPVKTLVAGQATYLKASVQQSSELSDGEKCEIAQGQRIKILGSPQQDAQNHFKVVLQEKQCALKRGFIYGPHFKLSTLARQEVTSPGPVVEKQGEKKTQKEEKPGGSPGKLSQKFVWPVLGPKKTTSGWCVCRGVGTSPHIGLDIVAGTGKQVNYALGNLKVVKSYSTKTCGYILVLQDHTGANWRYVHLANPHLRLGERVPVGKKIAGFSSKAACVTGAHLHLERRSAGGWGTQEKIKSCQNGPKTCHWDPKTPLDKKGKLISSAAEMLALANSSSGTGVAFSSRDAKEELIPLTHTCHPEVPAPAKVTKDDLHGHEPGEYRAQVELVQYAEGKIGFSIRHLYLGGNESNDCEQEDCIIAWSLVEKRRSGAMQRVLEDRDSGYLKIHYPWEMRLCLAEFPKEMWVNIVKKNGETSSLRVDIERKQSLY